jgi:hypothetical protein
MASQSPTPDLAGILPAFFCGQAGHLAGCAISGRPTRPLFLGGALLGWRHSHAAFSVSHRMSFPIPDPRFLIPDPRSLMWFVARRYTSAKRPETLIAWLAFA